MRLCYETLGAAAMIWLLPLLEQLSRGILTTFLLSLVASGRLAEPAEIRLSLVRVENRLCLSAANFRRIAPELVLSYLPQQLKGEIRHGNHKITFYVNKREFAADGIFYELEDVTSFYRNGLLFTQEFVEEVLTELSVPVKYRFSGESLIIRRAIPRRLPVDFIIIDAGHGGKDSGALGYFDVAEKDITLAIARELYQQLKNDFAPLEIYLTRKSDKFLSLERRSALANTKASGNKSGIFLSIHCNATLSPRVNGFEVYYLAQNSDNQAVRQALLRENLHYERSAYIRKLKSLLIDAQIQRESKLLARSVYASLANGLDGMMRARKVLKADFAVLRGTLMPAILIETGYLTNKKDLKRLQSADYRRQFARSLSAGIGAFFRALEKMDR